MRGQSAVVRGTALVCGLGLGLAGILGSPHAVGATGQPNQSCEDQSTRPGQSSTAPGSAFNPNGTAGSHYAGEQPQNSRNPQSVSQYDVACAQVSGNPGHR